MKLSLRIRTLLLVAGIAIISSFFFYLTAQWIILNSFADLEREEVNKNLGRASSAINSDLEDLKSITWDYAQWTDTYVFADDLNQEYIDANIIEETFVSLNVNLILITDLNGKLIYGSVFDLNESKFLPIPEDLVAHLNNNATYTDPKKLHDLKAEIVSLESGPMFLGSRGISLTDGTGEINQILFMGYFFNKAKVKELSKQTELDLSIIDLHAKDLSPIDKTAIEKLASSPTFIFELSRDRIEGFALLRNSDNDPVLLLQAIMSRSIYRHGHTVLNYTLLALLSLSFLFCLTTFIMVDRYVIRRIIRVGSMVAAIGQNIDSGSLSPSPDLASEFKGQDEITSLAKEFDKTYSKLISTHNDLQESDEAFRNISTHLNEALMLTDRNGLIVFWNDAAEKMFTLTKHEVINKMHCDKVISDRNATVHIKSYANLEDGTTEIKGRTTETFALRSDGTEFPIEISISAVKIKGYWHALSLIRDMSQSKAFELINRLAKHDDLTGLPNRICLSENLRRAIGHAERTGETIAIHNIDIDNFKDINDTLGHDFGDLLVLAITERLRHEIRKEDCLARVGGDEFVVIQEEAQKLDVIAQFSNKLIETLSRRFDIGGKLINITPSIGISVLPPGKEGVTSDPMEMLKEADIALSKAKDAGRNTYKFYSKEASDIVARRLSILQDLRTAVEKNQFVLHYQPQFDLQTGKIVGAEALIRWEHPDRGMIYPGEFIEISETSGLIIPIGRWVIKEACREAVRWQHEFNKELEIGVNLSFAQFTRENISAVISDALIHSGLKAELLCIEITEGFFAANPQGAIRILHDIHALGIKISIDDFGTGYSSLSYLKDFPVDTLKIDKAFVDDISPYGGGTIAEATIMLGHNLNLKVLAEGVETEEQADFLKSKGCDQVQGFYFGRPMSANKFANLLEH